MVQGNIRMFNMLSEGPAFEHDGRYRIHQPVEQGKGASYQQKTYQQAGEYFEKRHRLSILAHFFLAYYLWISLT